MRFFNSLKARLMMFVASLMTLKTDNRGYAKVVGGLVGLLITIIVGILVYWQISGAITFNSADANTSRDGVNTIASTVFSLLPIIAIVVIGSILISLVAGFGGKSGGKGKKG